MLVTVAAGSVEIPNVAPPLLTRRWVLSPLPALRVARATTRRPRWQRWLRPVIMPIVAATWYLRLAWYAGTTGVLIEGRAVLAFSGPSLEKSRPQWIRGLAALAVATVLLSAAVAAVMVGSYALVAAVSAALAAWVLTAMLLGLAFGLSSVGLYCVTRLALPQGRLDALAASITPKTGWQLKALAGTGASAAQEEAQLLTALIDRATFETWPVVAAVLQIRDPAVLTGEQRFFRVAVPGASRHWPPLLVAGRLPPSPPDPPTVQRRWPVLAGFSLVVGALATPVGGVFRSAVYLTLPTNDRP